MIINDNVLTANDGYVLTNGSAFGKTVYLGKNDSVDNWHEITEEEAKVLQEQEITEPTEATEEDFVSALEDLGVNFNE